MSDRPLLLEIGVEEIPARFLPGALENLKQVINQELLVKKNIPDAEEIFNGLKTMGTPRRLAAIVEGLPAMQADRVEEVFGPPKNIAYNEDGSLSKAGEGFARSQGVAPEDLVVKQKGKGEYVAAVVTEKGRPILDVLPEALKEVVLSLHFPKSMRWGDGDLRFARPIHWIVALYGGDVVGFQLDGIKSGNRTRGHRFLAPGEVEIKDADKYVESLKKASVIVTPDERVGLIKEQSEKLAASVSGVPFYVQEEHVRDVANLVEYPQAVMGSFDEQYLELPDELLNSVMWGHQKYFSVVNNDTDKTLKNYFIIVSNTTSDNADTVRRGAQRVIRARFDDARFYYEEDRQKTLADRVDALKKVTFHEKLGSLNDKTMRVKALASRISEGIAPELRESVERAVLLSKTDLITGVVYEFPELQGIMGQYYAISDGEDASVAAALREQYLPAFAGDAVPAGDVGAIVGLADRMDNLAAFYSIGLKPTGSEDPFALRRQALAVISILTAKGYGISLSRMLGEALEVLGGLRGPEGVEREILEFITLRLEGLLVSEGRAADVVQSAIGFAADLPLSELKERLGAVEAFKSDPAYNDFLMAIKRVRNITPKEAFPFPDPNLMREEEERSLLKVLGKTKAVEDMVKGADYSGAIGKLLELTTPINDFFDKVLVMDKDESIKNNRLALLKDIWSTASLVADFSKLAERE
jgi:glycyl-tRNA synthetase beta chain